jgi:hypothetical protein
MDTKTSDAFGTALRLRKPFGIILMALISPYSCSSVNLSEQCDPL